MNDKVHIDALIVQRLIADQFPQWRSLVIKPVENDGWDNKTFHLGERMKVRLPSAARYVPQVEKEHFWLPKIAQVVSLAVPSPLAVGKPSEDYPFPWSIYDWIEGEIATTAPIKDMSHFAITLAEFLISLQKVDVGDAPVAGLHNFYRGGSLHVYDLETRSAISTLKGDVDTQSALSIWEAALSSNWLLPPVWVHGDFSSGNLLVNNGKLSVIIDFGSSAVGDPACDMYIAWTFLDKKSRELFRTSLAVDDATWARGRGWVLWKALIILAKQEPSNASHEWARKVLQEVLDG